MKKGERKEIVNIAIQGIETQIGKRFVCDATKCSKNCVWYKNGCNLAKHKKETK